MPVNPQEVLTKLIEITVKVAEVTIETEHKRLYDEINRCHYCRGSNYCDRHRVMLERKDFILSKTEELLSLIRTP